MGMIKGTAIRDCKNFILKKFPGRKLEEMKHYLTMAQYDLLENPNKDDFYPLVHYQAINRAIVRAFGEDDKEILKRLGRFSADEAVRGFYNIFFKFGSPNFILKRTALVFSEYYDKGRINVVGEDKRSVKLELSGFEDEKDFIYTCLTIEGWIGRALEICAGKSAKTTQEKCVDNGDAQCIFNCSW